MRALLPGPAVGVGVGAEHSCAVLDDRRLLCWGSDEHGTLGRAGPGPGTPSPTPLLIEGVTDAGFVDASAQATCTLTMRATDECLGSNSNSALGVGDSMPRDLPVHSAMTAETTTMAMSDIFGCAANRLGALRCWGGNPAGVLGNGTTRGDNDGHDVAIGGVSSIALGSLHTCVVHDGRVACWGHPAARRARFR